MLKKLYIKNYLIIKEAELLFSKGLNILTGETGAGKSIILDALSLILGERADYSIIKKENEKLIIEGEFIFSGNKKVINFLKERELLENIGNDTNIIIIRRELNKKGVSRNFINDSPVTGTDLKSFGDLIIDIHSQNEHQALLKKETHIEILDDYCGNVKADEFNKDFIEYKTLVNEYIDLTGKKEALIEKKSYIEFQLKEINDINPLENEDEILENELTKLENSEEISTALSSSLNKLYEGDENIMSSLSLISKEIKKISKYDSELEKLISEIESTYITLKDISGTLTDYNESLNFDPARIEEIRNRLGSLNFLKKKYNLKLNEIIEKAEELRKELDLTENYDYEIEKLKKKVEGEKEKLFLKAETLSTGRKKFAKELQKNITSYLKEVGLESADFKIEIKKTEKKEEELYTYKNILITHNGIDEVEFLVLTNKGDDFSPLRKTASGGEVSRIMLSIKAALTGKDKIPILVFDEIDAGISGRIAGKVGKLLKQISTSHQIISITHLPQIAALSDNHLFVSKKEISGETKAEIKTLNKEEKINEVAKMLSGEKITKSAIDSARELMKP